MKKKVGGYKATVQGQATGLRDVMATVASVMIIVGWGYFIGLQIGLSMKK